MDIKSQITVFFYLGLESTDQKMTMKSSELSLIISPIDRILYIIKILKKYPNSNNHSFVKFLSSKPFNYTKIKFNN